MPKIMAPTSKAQQVRVEVFWNNSTMFLPSGSGAGCRCASESLKFLELQQVLDLLGGEIGRRR